MYLYALIEIFSFVFAEPKNLSHVGISKSNSILSWQGNLEITTSGKKDATLTHLSVGFMIFLFLGTPCCTQNTSFGRDLKHGWSSKNIVLNIKYVIVLVQNMPEFLYAQL